MIAAVPIPMIGEELSSYCCGGDAWSPMRCAASFALRGRLPQRRSEMTAQFHRVSIVAA
jgi:hypothetical protein